MNKKQALALVANPLTTTTQLLELVNHEDVFVRRALASCKRFDVVEQLACDDHWSVRARVAASPYASSHAIAILQGETLESICVALASNPDLTTSATLHLTLIHDPRPRVRASIASNPTTSAQNAAILAEDSATEVRVALASNPMTPDIILIGLADDFEFDVRAAVRFNSAAPEDVSADLKVEFP